MSPLILTYHAVEDGPAPLCVAPRLFREQLDCLTELGVTTVTVAQLARGLRDRTLPWRAVAVTFDDGCASAVRTAAPALLERGMTATVFCVAGRLGGWNDWPSQSPGMPRLQLAGADELRVLAAEGFEIGAHGVDHEPLDAAPPGRVERELREGKAALEEAVGAPVTSVAYPYGAAAATALARELYAAGCTTRPAHVAAGDDPLLLPRVDVHYLRRTGVFRRVAAGGLGTYLRARGTASAWRRRLGR